MPPANFGARFVAAFKPALAAGLIIIVPLLLFGDLYFARSVADVATSEPLPASARLVVADPKRPDDVPVLVPFADLARFAARFPAASLTPPAPAGDTRVSPRQNDWLYRYVQRPRPDGSVEVTVHRTRAKADPEGWLLGVERFRYRVVDRQPIPEKFVTTAGFTTWASAFLGLSMMVSVVWLFAWLGLGIWKRFKPTTTIAVPVRVETGTASGWFALAVVAVVVALHVLVWPLLDPLSDDPVNAMGILVALAFAGGFLALGTLCLAIPAHHAAPGVSRPVTALFRLHGRRAVVFGVASMLVALIFSTSDLWLPRLTGKQHWFFVPNNVRNLVMDVQTFTEAQRRLPQTLDELPGDAQEHLRRAREDFAAVEFAADAALALTLHQRSVVGAKQWVIPRVVRGDAYYWDWCHSAGLPDQWQPRHCAGIRWVWMDVLDGGIREELLDHARGSGKALALELARMPALNPAHPARAMLTAAQDAGGGRLRVTLSDHPAVPGALRGRTVTIHAELDLDQHEWSPQKGKLRLRCSFADGAAVPRQLRPDDCGQTFD